MFRNRLWRYLKTAYQIHSMKYAVCIPRIFRLYKPITFAICTTAHCAKQEEQYASRLEEDFSQTLDHEFLIRQATTVSVNAATQLLTITLVAIQDTNERLRDALTKEICLINQTLEWGEEGTPPHHWDELVAVRGTLDDLRHNLRTLSSYMDYAEKLATVSAEISFLSGNIAASDAICERIDHACRTCNTQKQLTHELQQESLELQQKAIINSPQLKDKLSDKKTNI